MTAFMTRLDATSSKKGYFPVIGAREPRRVTTPIHSLPHSAANV